MLIHQLILPIRHLFFFVSRLFKVLKIFFLAADDDPSRNRLVQSGNHKGIIEWGYVWKMGGVSEDCLIIFWEQKAMFRVAVQEFQVNEG